jgi:uncharacterized protein
MHTDLGALLTLQNIERQLAQVRSRLKRRQNAVNVQQRRIDKLQEEYDALHARAMEARKSADALELGLKSKAEKISHLREALNNAKSNKEYAALLTEINTHKADNAGVEEQVLTLMQEAETVTEQADEVKQKIEPEREKLAAIQASSQAEIDKLSAMVAELEKKRDAAAEGISPEVMTVFERIAERYEGEAMAPVEVMGRKPPYDYVCGGCYMALTAEHANALRMRDEIRRCDNCGRILYMDEDPAKT